MKTSLLAEKIILSYPSLIRIIDNPPEYLMINSVSTDPYNIYYIKNPTDRVQMIAVYYDPSLIRLIENPCETVQLFAVQDNVHYIKYIKNPTDGVQQYVVDYVAKARHTWHDHLWNLCSDFSIENKAYAKLFYDAVI